MKVQLLNLQPSERDLIAFTLTSRSSFLVQGDSVGEDTLYPLRWFPRIQRNNLSVRTFSNIPIIDQIHYSTTVLIEKINLGVKEETTWKIRKNMKNTNKTILVDDIYLKLIACTNPKKL